MYVFSTLGCMLDLGEGLSLEADNLPSVVYLSPVQSQPPLNDGYFMFVKFGDRQAQIFGCVCPKHKGAISYHCWSEKRVSLIYAEKKLIFFLFFSLYIYIYIFF